MSDPVSGAIGGSAVLGAFAADDAASTQADAANRAAALSDAQYQQTRADQAPYREAGVNALANVQRMAGNVPGAFSFNTEDLYKDPGYEFRLSEGLRSLAHSNNAGRGGLVTGNSLKAMQDYVGKSSLDQFNNAYNRALTSYNTGVASENQLYNRQAGMAGIGQTATNLTNAAGANNANAMSGYLTGGAAAQAAGGVGVANAATSGLGTYMNYTNNNNLLAAIKENAKYRNRGIGGGYGGDMPRPTNYDVYDLG
jgi:hypothetical protein